MSRQLAGMSEHVGLYSGVTLQSVEALLCVCRRV
jgi:hypothetical protein